MNCHNRVKYLVERLESVEDPGPHYKHWRRFFSYPVPCYQHLLSPYQPETWTIEESNGKCIQRIVMKRRQKSRKALNWPLGTKQQTSEARTCTINLCRDNARIEQDQCRRGCAQRLGILQSYIVSSSNDEVSSRKAKLRYNRIYRSYERWEQK